MWLVTEFQGCVMASLNELAFISLSPFSGNVQPTVQEQKKDLSI